MANSSIPKHDFAPAWLKIPGESHSSFHSERLSRRDDPVSGKGLSLIGRQRQSSCDQQYSRRERQHDVTVSRHHPSHRHHSIDTDESQYYNSGFDEIGTHRSFGSQPSLNRRPQSRQETNSAVYKGYSLYDSFIDGSRSNGWKRQINSERHGNSHNNSKDSSGSRELNECSTDRFNLEFPSLRGDETNESTMSLSTVDGGVWSADNLRNTKIYLDTSNKKIQNESGQKFDADGSILSGSSNGSAASPKAGSLGTVISKANSQNQLSSSVYRVLVPSKQNILTKKPVSKDMKSSAVVVSNKISRQSSPTQQLEILNTRFVTHPKNLGNKKSDFLKTLRNEETREEKNGYEKENEQKNDKIEEKDENIDVQQTMDKEQNGRDIVQRKSTESEMSPEKPILSSSLEAEQRLLKEMGWKEEGSGDEDVYAPLTEDELREFESLSKKIREQSTFQRPVWSPKKRIPFATTSSIIELDDDSNV
uniref:Vasculin n=1 Tax=Strigamia maritima TaxID=126957 RepID=T1JBC2_STRMM